MEGFIAKERAKKDIEQEYKTKEASDPKLAFDKMPAETKNKVGTVMAALKGLRSYEEAINEGQRPSTYTADTDIKFPFGLGHIPVGRLPLVGVSDTKLNSSERYVRDAIQRLQSGGALNEEEIKFYKNMQPAPNDTDEMIGYKINQIRDFLTTKLQGFGINPEQVDKIGFPKDVTKGLLKKNKKGGLLTGTEDTLEQ